MESTGDSPANIDMSATNSTDTNHEFEYLTTEDFSAEKFKLEIKNLPKYYGVREFRDFLVEDLMLQVTKFKRPRTKCQYAFVCLKNEEERSKALAVLNKAVFKKQKLKACLARPCADPLIRKRRNTQLEINSKICTLVNKIESKTEERNQTPSEMVRNVTTPLWNIPYDEQMKQKHATMKRLLNSFHTRIMDKLNPVLSTKKWAQNRMSDFEGLICPVNDIIRSNIIDGNKCEFTIGMNSVTAERTIGFRVGKYADGLIDVGPIDRLRHIPDNMKSVIAWFEVFVRNSKLDVFSPYLNKGHLKQLTVRCSTRSEIMIILQIHAQQLSDAEKTAFQRDLVQFSLKDDLGSKLGVTSLYIEYYNRKSDSAIDSSPILLHGRPCIEKCLLGLRFRISPQSFFQVNSSCAESLYQLIIRLADLETSRGNTVLVDVCCGTGTIALCAAKFCRTVYGLEECPAAILDANANAKLNNIENCEFIVGKAEKTLPILLHQLGDCDEIIAIVDPPRAGLAKSVITTIRTQQKICKLIYVSCNPTQAANNFDALCKRPSKEMGGVPFVPCVWAPVDMFPHTEHCELVVKFERFDTISE